MSDDLGKSFEKLISWTFPKHRGKTIERLPDGFMVFNRKFKTWEQATEAVDEYMDFVGGMLGHSLNKIFNKKPYPNKGTGG